MFRLLAAVLFLLQAQAVLSANCSSDYTDIGNGVCRSAIRGSTYQYKAYALCAAENAYMATINNAFENSNVASLIGSNQWLGLTCTSSQKTSCLWDNGVSIINTSYTNFASGHPNMVIGACVYISSSGYWYSASCTATSGYFYVCQMSAGIYVPQCSSPSYYFRGHCYYPLNALGYGKAVTSCVANCGNIASIHNDGENSYVRDIATISSTSTTYAFIGLTYSNSSFQWDDGTPTNFDNFGFKNTNLGSCVFIATANGDVVPRGQWMSSDCSSDTVAICKTDVICPITTETPPQCSGTQFLTGSGTLMSPNYPLGSGPNHCQYVITADPDQTVVFTMQELALNGISSIKAYNSPLDTNPFITFDSSSQVNNGTAYFAAGNFLKILFDTSGDVTFRNLWKLRYGIHQTGPDHCGSTFSTSPEVISGPHSAMNCTYVLRMGATTKRTCLRFSSLGVQKGDTIAIYDGPISLENQIGLLASTTPNYYVMRPALCSSTSDFLTVVTFGGSGLNYEMFVLEAADSPAILNPLSVSVSFTAKAVPCSDSGIWQGSYSARGIVYDSGDSTKRVKADLSYLVAFDPNYVIILDGNSSATVALAYGSLTNSRRTYQSSQRYLEIVNAYSAGGWTSTQYTGSFTAV